MSMEDSEKILVTPAEAGVEQLADPPEHSAIADASVADETVPSLTVMVGEDAIPDEAGDDAGSDEPASGDAQIDDAANGGDEGPTPGSAAGGPEEPDADEPSGKVSDELKRIIEALIYASPDPLTPKTLFKVLESEPREDVQASLQALMADYAEGRGGLHLVEVAGGYQIVTRPELSEWVRRLFHERKTQKLSVQALETLAVIAYKQPITAPEIAEIRGVNTSGVVATLLERRLIKIAGRKQVVGRPFLYSTTREFLIRFGLRDLADLPKMEDMADVLGFDPPSGLAEAGPSETLLPLGGPDPDQTLAVEATGEALSPAADAIEPEADVPGGPDDTPEN
jgi:segregation and condensation protein B